MTTNLIGRPAAYFDPNKKKQNIGRICAMYDQLDPRIAPRVAIELPTGEIVSAPLDLVWLLQDPDGAETLIVKDLITVEEKTT